MNLPLTRAWACLALLLFAFCMAPRPAMAESPFAVPSGNQAGNTSEAAAPRSGVMAWAMSMQQGYYRDMARAVRAFNLDHSVTAAWALLTISFLYGIFHAVGPGHGKVVVSSYLLANEDDLKRGILIAFLASFAQALTAILVVGILAMLLGLAHRTTLDSVPLIERASYLLLCLMGGWLIWRALVRGHTHDHSHTHHDHDHSHHDHAHMPGPEELRNIHSLREMAGMVLAVGLRPCSGAILVLLFALAQNAFVIGAVSAFAMSIGTALTVSGLALLTVFSRNMALKLAGQSDGIWANRLERALRLAGGALILLMGLLLLIASFTEPTRPFL
ncbi:MAG: nickel transporter [Rhizobiales bacterium]|nr:nickel transporter [Hyphomicrobiales bacterium]